jgi:hypothetical protein
MIRERREIMDLSKAKGDVAEILLRDLADGEKLSAIITVCEEEAGRQGARDTVIWLGKRIQRRKREDGKHEAYFLWEDWDILKSRAKV